jgi:hypothetical protein
VANNDDSISVREGPMGALVDGASIADCKQGSLSIVNLAVAGMRLVASEFVGSDFRARSLAMSFKPACKSDCPQGNLFPLYCPVNGC